jgi:hypothetical protein
LIFYRSIKGQPVPWDQGVDGNYAMVGGNYAIVGTKEWINQDTGQADTDQRHGKKYSLK